MVFHKKRVLIVQKDPTSEYPLMWEFPGGKIRPDETVISAATREIEEELHLQIVPERLFPPLIYAYASKTVRLHPVVCRCYTPEQLTLTEHIAAAWVLPQELAQYVLLPADIPIAEKLKAENS